ncbi:MAG: TetR/AcrR family transcriptional regulator [Mycetocola sp.]
MSRAADRAPVPKGKPGVRRTLVETEIYEQATRLFAQRGYSGTSIQDIADAVGLTRPALYHYVQNKDDLLAKLVAEITVVAATDVAALAQRNELSAAERVREIVQHIVHQQCEHGERFRLLLRSEADLPESVADSYAANRRAVLRSLTRVIEEGIALGEFRPMVSTTAAFGVLGIVNWVAWWYRPGAGYDADSIAVELAELAVHGLVAEPGRTSSTTPGEIIGGLRRDLDRLETLVRNAE